MLLLGDFLPSEIGSASPVRAFALTKLLPLGSNVVGVDLFDLEVPKTRGFSGFLWVFRSQQAMVGLFPSVQTLGCSGARSWKPLRTMSGCH